MIRFFLLACFLPLVMHAQNQTDKWYFGIKAALDFSPGEPIALIDSQMDASEGSSSIADSAGNLLFYTNGKQVWNRNHTIMPNGSGLHAHISSTQAACIVPKPGSSTLYYIFTTDAISGGNGYGLQYSEVDMALDGGNGAVTLKNIPLIAPTAEKLAVVAKNNHEYWVVTHGHADNKFYAYKVTSAGVDTAPIISTIGQVLENHYDSAIGQMKISPKGSHLVAVHSNGNAELFDFDLLTGQISNCRILFTEPENYGAEFSASGRMLYATGNFGRRIYQFDLLSADIPASRNLIVDMPLDGRRYFNGMQLANNGKIYIAPGQFTQLTVIEEPEKHGVACDLQMNAISLGGRTCIFGLPSLCSSWLYKAYMPITAEIPKGISPNDDSINDSFDLRALMVDHLTIFNRYGLRVYEKNNYLNEWKGQDNGGKLLPTGTYYYYIKTNFGSEKTGWVYLNY
jgi:gliding motility-associated-like protein